VVLLASGTLGGGCGAACVCDVSALIAAGEERIHALFRLLGEFPSLDLRPVELGKLYFWDLGLVRHHGWHVARYAKPVSGDMGKLLELDGIASEHELVDLGPNLRRQFEEREWGFFVVFVHRGVSWLQRGCEFGVTASGYGRAFSLRTEQF